MDKITKENMPELFRSSEDMIDLELELLNGDKTIYVPFKKPGMIQVAEIIRLILETFSPKEITLKTLKKLNIEAVENMSDDYLNSLSKKEINDLYRENIYNLDLESQFQAAVGSMGMALNSDSEITEEEFQTLGKNIYSTIFFKHGNVDIIELLIRDCFDLEARDLKDDVLMVMIGRLLTYLLDLTSVDKN